MALRHKELLEELHNQLGQFEHQKDSVNSRALLVDGLNLFLRAFAASPMMNDDGVHIGGISGFLLSLGFAINVAQPTRIIVVFDGKGGSVRRKKLYPEYKERRTPDVRLNRTESHGERGYEEKLLHTELYRVTEYLKAMPLTLLAVDNVEADDVIAYIASSVLTESRITIMSTDKDFLQLCDDRIEVWSPTKKKVYTPQVVYDEFGVMPKNFVLFRAISGQGDKSDNISGIRGFGAKTIVKKFPVLSEQRVVAADEIVTYADANKGAGKQMDLLYTRLYEGRDLVERNVRLMQLSDVDISATTKEHVLNRIHESIPPMNKYELMKMVYQDKLWCAIPNFEVWLREHWNTIERFARLTQSVETTS